MAKLLICPECGKEKWVREDAKVCSSKCRLKKWRLLKWTESRLDKLKGSEALLNKGEKEK
jgi:hypothetical protein